jgi:hypothetical protein
MYAYLDTAAAVVAMRDDDEHRYDGCLMFSALPGAPMLSAPTTGERLREVVRRAFARRLAAPAGSRSGT